MSERYRLRRLFAQGGMAQVYLGVSVGAEGFERPVAIKRMLPELAKDPRVAKMFLAEARLAKYLAHQNVVQVLDVGRGDDGLYLVMELVDGWDVETLWELARSRGVPFPPPLAAFIIAQTLAGLIHAYRRTHEGKPLLAAHRDISGSNVLVSTEGEAKVTDFGIARVEGLGGNNTEPGTFKGKLAYASPELLRGEPADHASDQFALGVLFFKLLAGEPPFPGAEVWATYYPTMMAHTPALPASVPQGLAQLVLRMLQKSAKARFESPEALARALASYLSSCGAPTSSSELAAFLQTLSPPLPAAQEPAPASGDTQIRTFSLKSETGAPRFAEVELQADWQPSGPMLDESGALRTQGEGGTPVTAAGRAASGGAGVPCLHCGTTLPYAGARCPGCDAAALEAKANEELQLARPLNRDLPPPPEPPPPPPPPRATGRVVWTALMLAVVAGGGFAVYRFGWPFLSGLLQGQKTAVLRIDSEPPGASILIDGQTIGTTPYFTENLYPPRDIPLQVVAKGYQPWQGRFTGGKDAQIEAVLRRR